MSYKLYINIITNLFVITPILSNIYMCNVLENKETGKKILLYADAHNDVDNKFEEGLEQKQEEIIFKNLEKILKNNNVKVLYEGPKYSKLIKKVNLIKENSHFLFNLTDFANSYNYSNKMINIDNRDFLYEDIYTYLKLIENEQSLDSELLDLKNKLESDAFKDLEKESLYDQVYLKALDSFNKLKIVIDKTEISFDENLKIFFKENIKLILDYLENFKKEKQGYSLFLAGIYMFDLNALLHVINSNFTDSYIIFAGVGHVSNLITSLQKYCGFNIAYSSYEKIYKLKEFDKSKALIRTNISFSPEGIEEIYIQADYPSENDFNLIGNL